MEEQICLEDSAKHHEGLYKSIAIILPGVSKRLNDSKRKCEQLLLKKISNLSKSDSRISTIRHLLEDYGHFRRFFICLTCLNNRGRKPFLSSYQPIGKKIQEIIGGGTWKKVTM